MKRINRDGPRVLGGFPHPPQGDTAALGSVIREGGLVVDMRAWRDYRTGHVRGTLSIPLNRSFTTWAGWLIPYDADFHLIAPDAAALEEAVRDLAMIGLDRVAGWFPADVLDDWVAGGGRLEVLEERAPADLREDYERGAVTVLDVRGQAEWDEGHLPGVQHIPLGSLRERLDEVPRDRPVVAYCKSGGRSAIAASLLAAHGVGGVINMEGGYDRWLAEGRPVASGTRAAGEPGGDPAAEPVPA
jgi:hydroxyacylglutathione hydrolase